MDLNAQLKEAREKAAVAIAAAGAIRDEKAGGNGWTAEAREQFDRAMADFAEAKKTADSLEHQIEQFNKLDEARRTLASPPPARERPADAPPHASKRYAEAFSAYIRQPARCSGMEGLTPETRGALLEQYALIGTQSNLGGALVPEDFRAEVIKDMAARAVIRSIARVVPCSGDTLVYPTVVANADTRRSSGFAGDWKTQAYVSGGTAPTVQNQPTFGQARIAVNTWAPDAIEISNELLDDAAVPVESVIAECIADTLSGDEDNKFTNGSGVNEPTGFQTTLQAASQFTVSGSASAVTYAGLLDLFGALPAQYRQNATWVMNSTTHASILGLLDSQNRPIFPVNQVANSLWDRPIRFNEYMPSEGSNTYPICFGDFRYYVIADRAQLRVQRLTERFAPNVGFLPVARIGGLVVRNNAFRLQKCAA